MTFSYFLFLNTVIVPENLHYNSIRRAHIILGPDTAKLDGHENLRNIGKNINFRLFHDVIPIT